MKKLSYKIKNIYFVTTNRADYGLQKNLIKEISLSKKYNLRLIVGGAHNLKEFGNTIKQIKSDKIKIYKSINIKLNKDTPHSISLFNHKLSEKINDIFLNDSVDFLFLLGDRSELFNIAGLAKIYNIPVGHLHGGESTLGAIDDSIRASISHLSTLHFVSHKNYKKKLISMKIEKSTIFIFGGLGASSIVKSKFINKMEIERKLNLKLKKKIILVSYHPVTLENHKTKVEFQNLLGALTQFKECQIIITSPNTDVNFHVINKLIKKFVSENKNFHHYFSLGNELYYSLMKLSSALVGNSSSGILEAPSFNTIGILNIGNRQGGRIQAKQILNCSSVSDDITKKLKKILFDKKFKKIIAKGENPYFIKNTEKNIVKILNKFFNNKIIFGKSKKK